MMISFTRLSSDNELTALLAAGYSIKRSLLPCILLASILYIAGSNSAIHLEAWGRREFVQFIYRKTQTEIDNMIRFKIQPGVFTDNFLDYVFYTEKISPDRTSYENVLLSPKANALNQFTMTAPRAQIKGSVEEGNLRMIFHDGLSYSFNPTEQKTSTLRFERIEIDLLRVFHEQILGEDTARDDYRSYDNEKLLHFLSSYRKKSDANQATYLKASYLYHSRRANPFIVFAFALLGLILGVQEQRHSKSTGYIGSILVIISCFVIMVACRWLAEHAYLEPKLAAWSPQGAFLAFALFLFYQKNRLPPSEPILAWRNMPFR